jgi:hypothetical protein
MANVRGRNGRQNAGAGFYLNGSSKLSRVLRQIGVFANNYVMPHFYFSTAQTAITDFKQEILIKYNKG